MICRAVLLAQPGDTRNCRKPSRIKVVLATAAFLLEGPAGESSDHPPIRSNCNLARSSWPGSSASQAQTRYDKERTPQRRDTNFMLLAVR
jgi:hypothetical protein